MKKSEKIANDITKKYVENWRDVYKDYSSNIEFILKTLLLKNSIKHKTFCREKDPKSLKRKLLKSGCEKMEDIKDLAGCRILFYIQEDMEILRKHLWDEFEVIETKLHYPFSNESENDVYYAEHFLVKLKGERLKLPEYARFKNLRCEIQLTTVLYHSSSELEHDISYKPSDDVMSFYDEEIGVLKKRFAEVLQKYIRPAQNEFNDIWRRFNAINNGKREFGYAFTKNIYNPKSINDLYANLNFLKDKLEFFGGKLPDNIDIFKIVRNSLKKAKELKTTDIDTPLGKLAGHDFSDILGVCLNILNYIKFGFPKETSNLLLEVYDQVTDSDNKKKVIEVFSSFANNDYRLLQNIGHQPKIFILGEIEKWNNKELNKRMELCLGVGRNLLSPSFKGTSMKDYRTMVFSSGPLNATKDLAEIRNRSISLLKKAYLSSRQIKQKKEILSVMDLATQTPHQGNYSDELKNMILDNTKEVVNFYIEICQKAENEIISDIEEQVDYLKRRFGDEKIAELKNLEDKIDKNADYQTFRVLIGYDDRLSEKISWEESRRMRTEKINEMVKGISRKNFKKWEDKIFGIVKNSNSSDLGEYQYFNIFLTELAKRSPSLAFKILKKENKLSYPFLYSLLAGVLRSDQVVEAKDLVKSWIAEAKHIDVIANVFSYDIDVDNKILGSLFNKAKEKNDVNALNGIIRIIVNKYPKYENKKLFIRTIKELSRLKNCYWLNDAWHQERSIIESLSENEIKIMLKNLLVQNRIDYHLETILIFIARKNPKIVIDFFHERIGIQESKKEKNNYDAIPFDLHILGEELNKDKNPSIVISEILKWFDSKKWLYAWDASHLLEAIFPAFSVELEDALLGLIREGGDHNAKVVLSILEAYDGQEFLHKICKEILKKYGNKKYARQVMHILSKTGTVTGEYGFVDAYKKKKEEVQSWKSDRGKIIQDFIKEYEDYLDKQIIYEHKRADDQIELMKRNFE